MHSPALSCSVLFGPFPRLRSAALYVLLSPVWTFKCSILAAAVRACACVLQSAASAVDTGTTSAAVGIDFVKELGLQGWKHMKMCFLSESPGLGLVDSVSRWLAGSATLLSCVCSRRHDCRARLSVLGSPSHPRPEVFAQPPCWLIHWFAAASFSPRFMQTLRPLICSDVFAGSSAQPRATLKPAAPRAAARRTRKSLAAPTGWSCSTPRWVLGSCAAICQTPLMAVRTKDSVDCFAKSFAQRLFAQL